MKIIMPAENYAHFFILTFGICHFPTAVVTFMANQTNFIRMNEMQCLTQLPVEQLLKIRKTLQLFRNMSTNEIELNDRIGMINEEPTDTISLHMNDKARQNNGIIASPLIGSGYGYDIRYACDELYLVFIFKITASFYFFRRNKVGYPENDHESGKQTKIQKIFNFSVTALAFLAFSGYLLCMIVQAIKYKGISMK